MVGVRSNEQTFWFWLRVLAMKFFLGRWFRILGLDGDEGMDIKMETAGLGLGV